jgi:hypothetical protein
VNDLLFFVADKNMAAAVAGLLERDQVHRIVGCAPFGFDARHDIKVAEGQNDPGLYTRANELLRPLRAEYAHAVVIVDEEWNGSPGAVEIEKKLRAHLDDAGWTAETSLGLIVCPEADVWLWSDSPHSATALGWTSWDVLRPKLEARGFLGPGKGKPERPKEAAEWALRNSAGKKAPRSSEIYRRVSSQVSIQRCEDEALLRLLKALRAWFPAEGV